MKDIKIRGKATSEEPLRHLNPEKSEYEVLCGSWGTPVHFWPDRVPLYISRLFCAFHKICSELLLSVLGNFANGYKPLLYQGGELCWVWWTVVIWIIKKIFKNIWNIDCLLFDTCQNYYSLILVLIGHQSRPVSWLDCRGTAGTLVLLQLVPYLKFPLSLRPSRFK